MTDQITLKEALRLVSFIKGSDGKWRVGNVNDYVHGDVRGDVGGNVNGDVRGYIEGSVLGDVCGDFVGNVWGHVSGNVGGNVFGNVGGNVRGTILGKKWAFIETPREKLARLIKEKGDQELIKAFNELEDSND